MRSSPLRRLPPDEAGRDEDGALGQVTYVFADEAEQGDGGGAAHLHQRLTDGGEGGADGRGAGDVVESDHRDVAGDVQAGLVERGDGADGRGIVEAEEGREAAAAGDELPGGNVSGLAARRNAPELDDEVGIDAEAQGVANRPDRLPAGFGVGAEPLPFDEGDAAVAEIGQMGKGVASGSQVIDFDGENAGFATVTGDGDGRDGRGFGQRRVDGDDAFDPAGLEQTGVFAKEFRAVAVANDEVEEFLFEESVFNPAEDRGGVAFADFRDHDAHGEAALFAQPAGEGVGVVIARGRRFEDALLRSRSDAVFRAGMVEHARDGGERQAEVRGELLQADIAAAAGGAIGGPGSGCAAASDR